MLIRHGHIYGVKGRTAVISLQKNIILLWQRKITGGLTECPKRGCITICRTVLSTLLICPRIASKQISALDLWGKGKDGGHFAPEKHYPTMTTEEIGKLDIRRIADKNCALFAVASSTAFWLRDTSRTISATAAIVTATIVLIATICP